MEDAKDSHPATPTSTSAPTRQRFIPFRKADVVAMCLDDGHLSEADQIAFGHLARILESVLHFEFHRRLETIKDCYAPFNPDADTRRISDLDPGELTRRQEELVAELTALLDAANYERITAEDLDQALKEESLLKIRLVVDFDDFDKVLFFRRGEHLREETLRFFFGLRKRRLSFSNYERVVVFIHFKDRSYFEVRKRGPLQFEPGSTLVKLFHNVPKADLEMLFPNSRIEMKTIDKVLIGVPAAASGVAVLVTKLGASLVLLASLVAFWLGISDREVAVSQKHLVALAVGLAALGGYVFKQVNKFKNRKIRFMKTLADNLYFKNLDNNAGVFFHLVDAAEEEEFKEALLAYYFLLRAGGEQSRETLDRAIENWFESGWNCRVDFEIADALAKLERLGLAEVRKDTCRVQPLEEAKRRLDVLWDGYFDWS